MNFNDVGKDNLVLIDPTVAGNIGIDLYGRNNRLVIGRGSAIHGYKIELRSNNASIEIGEDCFLNGNFRIFADEAHIIIGAKTTMMNANVTCHEAGVIDIGEDCMFSGGVQMDISDMHSIYDLDTGQRINPSANIKIGKHVWLAEGVTVSKGSEIGAGSIVGAKSFVQGHIPENVIVAGIPARILRVNVEWRRELKQ